MARDEENVYYEYDPSVAAAAIFAALFGISAVVHTVQAVRKRAAFMTPFIIGAFFEAVGYIARSLSAKDTTARAPFIVQILLPLLAPALFAASIYMVLGRIILLTDGEKYSLVRRTWLTKIFVTSDVLTFLLQCGGGAIMAGNQTDPDKIKLGQNIILVGLFAQLVIFCLFILVAILFQLRGKAHLQTVDSRITWRKHLYVLYATSGLILVRSIFRIVEYIMGDGSYLMRYEVFGYVFDAALMLIVMVIVNAVHPGDIAPLLKEKLRGGNGFELSESLESQKRDHVHV